MNYAKVIDHTLLKTDASQTDIQRLCREAAEYGFATVCVSPCWVAEAHELLQHTSVNLCAVVGFPQGANLTEVKVLEAKKAIENGAREIDMVMAISLFKSGLYDKVEQDIAAVVATAHERQAIVKVIIEACLLTDQEKIAACNLAVNAGADFVKTSTGFSVGGATAEDVALMYRTVKGKAAVKAAGGIKSRAEADKMLQSGAVRLGSSSGLHIICESK